MKRNYGTAAGLAVLALVGMLVLASAPRGATPPVQTYAAAAITSPSASAASPTATATATLAATRTPARKAQPAAPLAATPTDTPAPAPTATDTPAPGPTPTATDTPVPATPTATATPANTPTPGPSWHDVVTWSGSSATTSYQYLGSWSTRGQYRVTFTCNPAPNGAQWIIELVIGDGASQGAIVGDSLCKPSSGYFTCAQEGYMTAGIEAEVDPAGDTGSWTLTVQEWY